MASSTNGLVPITRSFLARYYDKYPLDPLPDDVARLTGELRGLASDLVKEFPLSPGEESLAREADLEPPHKVDENLWRNREHIEEILFLLDKSHWPRSLQQKATPEDADIAAVVEDLEVILQKTLKTLELFQLKNADNVFNTVMTYMPQDFRGSLIKQQRERSERNRQAEVDALVKSGGSIRDRYALLWKQQMERRRQLAQLGSAAGVYKTLVKYLVGVPQVLLDFIKQINDDQGPMEEQRHRYGPSLYSLTKMALSIRLFLLLLWDRFEDRKLQKNQLSVIQQAVQVYTSEFEKFIKFIGEVFTNSPFFISADDTGAAESRKSDEYKETIILPGKTHEVNLTVDSVNSYIAWDFSLIQGTLSQYWLCERAPIFEQRSGLEEKTPRAVRWDLQNIGRSLLEVDLKKIDSNIDIGFRVEYVSPSGEITMILPYRRYESDQGNFCTILAGSYRLVWDNSYSTFFKKSLRYKVDAIPPVVETSQPVAEPE